MNSFNDARCKACGAQVSWVGPVLNMPPCPKCGHKPDLDEIVGLHNDQEIINEMKQLLAKRKKTRQ